jgi:hypothetical protein
MGQRCGTIKHHSTQKHRSVSALSAFSHPQSHLIPMENQQFWSILTHAYIVTWCGWHWMAHDGTLFCGTVSPQLFGDHSGPLGRWSDHCLGMVPPTLQALRPFDSACMALYGCLQWLGQFGNTIFTAVALAANSVALQSSSYLETSTFEFWCPSTAGLVREKGSNTSFAGTSACSIGSWYLIPQFKIHA